jgi:uncharacterized protein (DUF2147 family)
MTFFQLCSASAILISAFVDAGVAQADPRGLWLAHDGATVRVTSCGKGLCATIVSPKSQVDPSTGQPRTDKNNPDPMKRGRPLAGVEVFISTLPEGPGKWSGSLYNADDGHTYPGRLLEINERTIRIEGCAIGICGGQNMSRIR